MLPNAVASVTLSKDGAYVKHESMFGQKIPGADPSIAFSKVGAISAQEDLAAPGVSPTSETLTMRESAPASVHLRKHNEVYLVENRTTLDLYMPGDLTSSIASSGSVRKRTEIKVTTNGALLSRSRLIGHIPRLSQGEHTDISFLSPLEDDSEWVRMVWNKDSQESYSVLDYQSQRLPSIIYRNKRTVESLEENPERAKRRRLDMSNPAIQSLRLPLESPDPRSSSV